MLRVVAGGIDELILEPFLSSQIALRQRGPLVRSLGLVPNEYQSAGEAFLPESLGRRRSGGDYTILYS